LMMAVSSIEMVNTSLNTFTNFKIYIICCRVRCCL